MKTQLRFNSGFDRIIDDISVWKSEDDIPLHIINFIKNTSDNRLIYEFETEKYRCSKCLELVDDDFYCKKCDIKHGHNRKVEDKNVSFTDLENTYKNYTSFRDFIYYYIFDIVDNRIILYLVEEEVTYNNPLTVIPYKTSEISILETYEVKKEGIVDLNNNTYESYEDIFSKHDKCDNNEYSDRFHKFYNVNEGYIYLDNLEELKNTIYKYSFIWDSKEYLKSCTYISISMLTLLPLYIKEFEYLVKYKLYALAFTSNGQIKKGRNFKETFGVDKEYLPFMIQNDIDMTQLKSLILHPTLNIDELNEIASRYYDYRYLIKEVGLKYENITSYFKSIDLDYNYFNEYYDYIRMAKDMGYDMKDKKVLFPNDLLDEHDKLYLQVEITKDPKIDESIKKVANVASINSYEDENYIIFPADSIESLIDESKQQRNCVRTYSKMVADGECQIYFMREKKYPNKSLVTIEVREDKIVQARTKFNELPSDELKKILDKWQRSLLVISIG